MAFPVTGEGTGSGRMAMANGQGGQGWSRGLGLLFSCRSLKLSLQRLKEGRVTTVSWDSDNRGCLMRLNLNPYKKALK